MEDPSIFLVLFKDSFKDPRYCSLGFFKEFSWKRVSRRIWIMEGTIRGLVSPFTFDILVRKVRHCSRSRLYIDQCDPQLSSPLDYVIQRAGTKISNCTY